MKVNFLYTTMVSQEIEERRSENASARERRREQNRSAQRYLRELNPNKVGKLYKLISRSQAGGDTDSRNNKKSRNDLGELYPLESSESALFACQHYPKALAETLQMASWVVCKTGKLHLEKMQLMATSYEPMSRTRIKVGFSFC